MEPLRRALRAITVLIIFITQTSCKLYVGFISSFISSFVSSFVSKEGEPSTNYVKHNTTQIKWYIHIYQLGLSQLNS